MFKKSRIKIVASIMAVLVLLWIGTLGVIYTFSYAEMTKQDQQMLKMYAQMYILPEADPKPNETPIFKEVFDKKDKHGFKENFDPNSPMFRLSTFYAVAISYEGEILEVKNSPEGIHSNPDLTKMARRIIKNDKKNGTENNLAFYKADKDGYMLVVFMDNTVINESALTLFRYTLIFGGVALVLFFFLSVFLARKIVKPLEESYQKQKQFISDAGHELKTPVSVVSVNAELLSRELGDNPWLQNIQYENERMGLLVTQLLDLARTEDTTPQMEVLDFSRLVAGESLPFETVAAEKGLVINSNIAEGIEVSGNSAQLIQVVSILLDNAIRHSNAQSQVQLFLTKEHGYAKLSVINSGDEIPMQQRQQLFERFYRVDTARNSEDRHYGLGLAIAKAVITAHKGHIEVLCYDGLVEFRVQIPAL